jgi:hypothetical protein
MKNQLTLALAVAGGYVLGRTKKAKVAFGLGSLVLGKRLKLSPQQVATVVSEQISSNPQLAKIGEELRGNLKGVGAAATNALVTRRIDALADSLHDRTAGLRERVGADVIPGDVRGEEADDTEDAEDAQEAVDTEDTDATEEDTEATEDAGDQGDAEDAEAPSGKPARREATRKAPARKAAAKKTEPSKKGGRSGTSQARRTAGRTEARAAGQAPRSSSRRTSTGSGGGGRG